MDIEMIRNSLSFSYGVSYHLPNKTLATYFTYSFKHTQHSFKRAAQRGLDNRKISAILEYGDCYSKQGLIYYVLGKHNIPSHLQRELEKITNSVVIVCTDSAVVLTCYRSANCHKQIKLKKKCLSGPHFHKNIAAA